MQQDLGVGRQGGLETPATPEVADGRWSARRMIVVVSALSLLAWVALIASLFGL